MELPEAVENWVLGVVDFEDVLAMIAFVSIFGIERGLSIVVRDEGVALEVIVCIPEFGIDRVLSVLFREEGTGNTVFLSMPVVIDRFLSALLFPKEEVGFCLT